MTEFLFYYKITYVCLLGRIPLLTSGSSLFVVYFFTAQQTEVLPTPHVPSVLSSGLVLGRFFPHLVTMMRVDAKVVMLGKESVGKTSLVERYVHHRFLVGPYQNVSVSCSGYFLLSDSVLDEKLCFMLRLWP